MKVFEMAAVVDCGEYYEVEYLTSSLNKDFEMSNKYLGLSPYAAKQIKDAIEEGIVVRVIKDYQNIDVMPSDLIFVNTEQELDLQKRALVIKARQLVTHQQANVSGLMMYQYININNILCDKGFFIHDDNREEVYLKILETADELLIDKLEIYLNARDEISRSGFLEERYHKFFRDMKSIDNIDDATELYGKFVQNFQNAIK